MRSLSARSRPGTTLIELLVVLGVMGIVLSVVALVPPTVDADSVPTLPQLVSGWRRDASEHAAVEVRRAIVDGRELLVTALPDGQVLLDSVLGQTLSAERR